MNQHALRGRACRVLGLALLLSLVGCVKPPPTVPTAQGGQSGTQATGRDQPLPHAWERFRPPVGAGSVTFPWPPRADPPPPGRADASIHTYTAAGGTIYQFGVAGLGVDVKDVPRDRFGGDPEEVALTAVRDLLIRSSGGKGTFTRVFQFDGTAAIEFTMVQSTGAHARYFMFTRGKYQYTLLVGSATPEAVATSDAKRFLTSFRYEPEAK